jgi:uncharacterized protein (TIGR03663 family)
MTDSTNCCAAKETTTEHNESRWYKYFRSQQWVIFGALVLLGVIFRWTLLDMRPYHHDESLHGMYGRYFYDFPDQSFYRYDPMLHGPMLYNSMRFIFAMFGDSLWAARTPVCIMGTLFIFAPFVFRSFFSKASVLTLTGAVAISPTMVYWSRFLREDFWVVSSMLMVIYGLTLARTNLKVFLVLLGLTLQWVTKENIFVTLAIVCGYLAFEFFMERFVLRDGAKTLIGRMFSYVAKHPWATTWALIVSCLVFSWFYGAGFRYLDGIGDGLGKKGYDYWKEHHGMERIQGPFNFHLYMLSWYELPFVVAFLAHVAIFYRRASTWIQLAAATVVAAALTCLLLVPDAESLKTTEPFSLFKLKDYFDLFGAFFLLFHSPLVVIQHLINRERTLALTGYLFTATLFVYSYLGEKVPWLTMYPYIFGLPYLALFFESYLKSSPIDFRSYPTARALLWVGTGTLLLGVLFVLEASDVSAFQITVPSEDRLFLGAGALLILAACSSRWGDSLGKIHLGLWTTLVAVLYFTALILLERNFSDLSFWGLQNTSVTASPTLLASLLAAGLLILFAYLAEKKLFGLSHIFSSVPRGGCLALLTLFAFGAIFLVQITAGDGELLSPSRASAGAIQVIILILIVGFMSRTSTDLGRFNVLAALALLAVGYNIRGTLQANFLYAGKETEYISQVHTTYEIHDLAQKIVREVQFQPEAYKPNVYATGDATWPLTWYFRNLKESYKFNLSEPSERQDFTYLIEDYNDTVKSDLPEGFYSRKVNLRGWWVPDFREMTLKRFLRYAVNHYPWGPTGFTSVIVSVARDTSRFKDGYSEE